MRVTNIEHIDTPQTAYDLTVEDTECYFVGNGVLAHNCSLRFDNGRFTQAVTRGDGVMGEDITVNAKLMQFPKAIPGGFSGLLRGEVIVKRSTFTTAFPGKANPRNTASGTMKRLSDPEGNKHLTVIVFDMLPDDGPMDSKIEEFIALEGWGFETPVWSLANCQDNVLTIYETYLDHLRDGLDYDIDGLVIQFDDRERMEDLGDQGRGPKGAVAFKFPHEEKPTYLREIRWQVGNSGRVTPVAHFDAVNLAGAMVKQASLHNLGNIKRVTFEGGKTGFCIGDKILVCRRNDVIPYVEALLASNDGPGVTYLDAPTECPMCGSTLEMDGEYLVCRNSDACSAQTSGAIKRWIKKIGILHFGDALVEALMDAPRIDAQGVVETRPVLDADGVPLKDVQGNVTRENIPLVENIADLYTVDPDYAANLYLGSGRRVGGTARRAFKNLHAHKVLPLSMFVGSLGIPMIGRTMTETIIDGGIDSLNAMYACEVPQVAAIPGVGATKAHNFCKWWYTHANVWLISQILGNGVSIKKQIVGVLTGKSVCVTGTRDTDLLTAIEDAGGTLKGMSRKVSYLVCADPSSQSGKAKKARDYNATGKAKIEIMGIEDFQRKVLGLMV